MSYITERRGEEKERRRAEILDAAEALYAKKGWDALTVDQVARSARLSRALVYVYFRDKEELLFAIGERAMRLLRDRFTEAAASHSVGMDKVEAIGRAYMGYAYEFPHYFDFCTRFQAHSMAVDPGSHEGACRLAGDEVLGTVVQSIEAGLSDGSTRPRVSRNPRPRLEQLCVRIDTRRDPKRHRSRLSRLKPFFSAGVDTCLFYLQVII